MNPKRQAFVLTIIVVGVGVLLAWPFHPNEELVSKREWSVLQTVEFQHRDKPNNGIEFVTVDGYSLVGIPVEGTRKKVWVMLDAKNPPYYKQLPKGDYRLSSADLKKILTSASVTSTVSNCLESHMDGQ